MNKQECYIGQRVYFEDLENGETVYGELEKIGRRWLYIRPYADDADDDCYCWKCCFELVSPVELSFEEKLAQQEYVTSPLFVIEQLERGRREAEERARRRYKPPGCPYRTLGEANEDNWRQVESVFATERVAQKIIEEALGTMDLEFMEFKGYRWYRIKSGDYKWKT